MTDYAPGPPVHWSIASTRRAVNVGLRPGGPSRRIEGPGPAGAAGGRCAAASIFRGLFIGLWPSAEAKEECEVVLRHGSVLQAGLVPAAASGRGAERPVLLHGAGGHTGYSNMALPNLTLTRGRRVDGSRVEMAVSVSAAVHYARRA